MRRAVRTIVLSGLGLAAAFSGGLALQSSAKNLNAPDLAASHRVLVYGSTVLLSGRAAGPAGTRLTLLRRRFGALSFTPLALVETDAFGAWSYRVKPQVRTAWVVVAGTVRSKPVTVRVRPRVRFAQIRGGGFAIEVVSARTLAGRYVVLQQRRSRAWRPLRRIRLTRPALRVRVRLAPGARVRIFMPRAQTGPGYLAGVSRPLVVRRAI